MDSSRRRFFKQTLGVSAVLATSGLVDAATCKLTSAQTSGPFIPDDFPFRQAGDEPYLHVADSNTDLTVVDGGTQIKPKGQIIYLRGQVLDQDCLPVTGANVYLWQADDNGHYNHLEDPNIHSASELDAGFQYRGIASTDAQGRFQFKTIKPKYYPLDETATMMRTAHLHISVLHPKCQALTTQTYFEGDVLQDIDRIRELNANDIILSPRGTIRPELRDLIVNFRSDAQVTDGPVGDVTLSVRRLR